MRLPQLGVALAAAFLASATPVQAEPPSPPVVIAHAKVYLPGHKAALEDGTVVLSGGSVQAVGAAVAIPAGARVIDARGKVVTAGFIDADCAVGVVDIEHEPEANDTDVRGPVTPALRMADAYNPRSAVVAIARSGGVTSVVVAPPRGLLGGRSAFAELSEQSVSAALVRPVLAQYAHLDEESGQAAAGTRGAMWLVIREALDDTRFYAAHKAQYDANGARQLSLRREGLEALLPVIRGEQPIVIEAHRASDIETALQVADEYRLRLVLSGASEAWMVAGEIARRKVPVILDPVQNLPEHFDRLHARSDNAALLAREGVSVSIATFSAYGTRALSQHAGNAVRAGLDHDAAIRAVTEAPADAFGLRGYGRIEAGAVGDIVVWSGDPFQASTRVEYVFVRGREQPLETRQTLLLQRYRTLPVQRPASH
jgi:imidazolonepropionase-like amidohydrolase